VCGGISFNAFCNNPHLAAGLELLRPQYSLPGATTMRDTLLEKEYCAVITKVKAKIETAFNLTLSVDAWTDAQKRSILAFVLQFMDRTAAVLCTREASATSHTGEFMAGASPGQA
jgi:hypothetical protein